MKKNGSKRWLHLKVIWFLVSQLVKKFRRCNLASWYGWVHLHFTISVYVAFSPVRIIYEVCERHVVKIMGAKSIDFLACVAFWAVFPHLENSISPSISSKMKFWSAENIGLRKCYRFCRSELCESMIWRSNRIFKFTSLQIVESRWTQP